MPLPLNGRILIKASGVSRTVVANLALAGPRLLSKSDAVPLRVLARNDGELSVAQAVLEPQTPLRPATAYRLDIPGTDLKASWTTSAGPDQFPPRWSGPASVAASKREAQGAGPSAHVTVRAPVSDDRGIVLMLAEVRRRGSAAAPARFIVEVRDGLLVLGHGPCAGPFLLAPGQPYQAELLALDLAGNEAKAPGQPLSFTGPGDPPPAK